MATSQWEEAELSRESGRPARKYYRLSHGAAEFLAEAQRRIPLVVRNVPESVVAR